MLVEQYHLETVTGKERWVGLLPEGADESAASELSFLTLRLIKQVVYWHILRAQRIRRLSAVVAKLGREAILEQIKEKVEVVLEDFKAELQ